MIFFPKWSKYIFFNFYFSNPCTIISLIQAIKLSMLSPSSRHHAVFKVAAFINFWAKVMLFSCLQAYMTALNYFEKLKFDIIIYFRMFSFSNDLKKYKKSHSAILIFGQLWLDSVPLCAGFARMPHIFGKKYTLCPRCRNVSSYAGT